MLKNERGYYLDHGECMALFGIKRGGHWPPQGFVKTVQGVRFMCTKAPNKVVYERGSGKLGVVKRSQHRLFYECEQCDPHEWVPCGRAHQHKHNWQRKRRNEATRSSAHSSGMSASK